ncbi:MAG TPA: hypothetical protein VNF72_06100, partial [Myxococcota bacterium]|nr:hypothetical protein [Myxococcota bacterium]
MRQGWWLLLVPLLLAAAVDRRPPELSISLNGIPEDENDLLVVPPDHFRITLTFRDAEGPVDLASLSVRSSQAIGALPAGAELASHFRSTPEGVVWEIPAGSNLARTSHFLTASIRDAAGNETTQRYG